MSATATATVNGTGGRKLPAVRLYRDNPDVPVAFKTTFRIGDNRGINVRFMRHQGRLYVMLAGNVMELVGGRDTVLDSLGHRAVRLDYVNALRVVPAPGDQIHGALFTPIEAFETLDRVAAIPDLLRGLQRVREIAARNERLNAPAADGAPAEPTPVPTAVAPAAPVAVAAAGSRLDALRESARAKIAADRHEVKAVADRLAALQEAVLEAYTLPTADEQLAALRVLAEGLV